MIDVLNFVRHIAHISHIPVDKFIVDGKLTILGGYCFVFATFAVADSVVDILKEGKDDEF